jgi:hypothetical protein
MLVQLRQGQIWSELKKQSYEGNGQALGEVRIGRGGCCGVQYVLCAVPVLPPHEYIRTWRRAETPSDPGSSLESETRRPDKFIVIFLSPSKQWV